MRDGLLAQYCGQWVAVHNGKVIAAGKDLLPITEAAAAAGGHPYIACVGAEETVVFRVRRAVFSYDQSYRPFPLPHLQARSSWIHDVSPCMGTLPSLDHSP